MNKYYKIVMCFSLMLVSISCSESFLDEEVLDKYEPNVLKDKLGFDASVVGIHQHFATLPKSSNDQTIINMWHIGTDILWAPAGRSNGDARPYFDYTQLNASDAAALKVWRYLYKLINNANDLIAGSQLEIVGMTPADRALYEAEAKFFRAYAYDMLVTLFGGVPLVTEPTVTPRTDYTRASVAAVNALIEADLLFAVEKLPNIGSAARDGRANKAMARQLLGTAYLRMNENAKAEAQLTEIINGNSGALSLIKNRFGTKANNPGDPFSDIFIFGNQRRSQGNTEVIWVLENENPTDKPYSTDSPQQRRNWGGGYYDIAGMLPADSLGGRGIGRTRLNNWVLYGLYEDGDMRNSKYNLRRDFWFNSTDANYSTIKGLKVPYGVDTEFTLADGKKTKVLAADTVWRLAPYITKWNFFDSRDTFGYGTWKDFILMRLGETYLLRAEARFKQNNLSGAVADVNEVRNRANATPAEEGDMTLDYILDERARELIGEENRRYTLVRTGTLVNRAKTLTGVGALANGNIETTNGLEAKHLLLPIPQLERDLNKDADLGQNTGY
ncbi:RagB/SusD family nutrient uptake outer membrane protein [Pseudochryseolinea flava]|uniref:RagB/SusD family nutrient uptake outer membrane protein n=1 Tax=Pseudochryseolinea flava TaxID=2059302 RepID=A0A364XVS6_9BACT|nr:RagB/SusD family nutrient uptake outer membrane protein [Pseudochryseolinea flava]RAV98247.1 RagB/SusD family nutrient uptake outer membrane protein [Pseudochryseolinea flava]